MPSVGFALDGSEARKRGEHRRVSGFDEKRLERVVKALERIASALERPGGQAAARSWKTRGGCLSEALADAARAREEVSEGLTALAAAPDDDTF